MGNECCPKLCDAAAARTKSYIRGDRKAKAALEFNRIAKISGQVPEIFAMRLNEIVKVSLVMAVGRTLGC